MKFNDYERFGVGEYWLVDLRERHIRVFASKGGRFEPLGAFGAGERVQTQMLQGLELDPAQILPD